MQRWNIKLKLDYSNFRYEAKDHKYYLGNVELLSVTKILSVVSDYNHSNQNALDRGTYIHKACEMFEKGTLDFDKLEPDIQPMVRNFSKFLLDHNLWEAEVLIEIPLYSEKYFYAGRPDYIFFTEKAIIVPDVKSGAKYRSDFFQMIGYYNLVKENFDIDKPIILYDLYLKKGSLPEVQVYTKRDFNKFLCFKTTYQEKNNL